MADAFSAIMMVGALVFPLWHGGHDRGVHHPQRLQAEYPQLRVDHGADGARAGRVVQRLAFALDELLDASLDQGHPHVGIFTQPGSEHAAGRAGPDDDVVTHGGLQMSQLQPTMLDLRIPVERSQRASASNPGRGSPGPGSPAAGFRSLRWHSVYAVIIRAVTAIK